MYIHNSIKSMTTIGDIKKLIAKDETRTAESYDLSCIL